MNLPSTISLLAGFLQFAVAGYALWLTRRFGVIRPGWLLFSAFSTLAALHWLLSMNLIKPNAGEGLLVDEIYVIVSALLLAGMTQLEAMLRRHRQVEQAAQAAQARFETSTRDQTEQLSKANEELRRTAEQLKAEIAERERRNTSAEKTHRDMLVASRRAGMSEVATAVLHNVGNVLNSVNVSAAFVADHVAEFKIDNISRVAGMMREHEADLGNFLTRDSKGRQLPAYLAKLGEHLENEQSAILKEIDFVRSKIEHIKQIVSTQQSYGKVMGLTESVRVDELVEDVLRLQAAELTEHQVQVHREYEPGLPLVVVDKHKVLQILVNLLQNAKQACLESPQREKQATIRVTNGDDRVRVSVSDNGVGIAAPNLKRIFNHGFTTRKNGGHGFGLHGSALAARELGGELAATSDGPGRGATFTLIIPLKSTPNSVRL